jgi:flagellar motor switch protein FliN/FliY
VSTKSQVHHVDIELSVVLGRCSMPMQQLLRMGRGAVIELDTTENDPLRVYANNTLIAEGEVKVDDGQLSVELTRKILRRA